MNENYPNILDWYYTFGEKIGDSNIRHIDNLYWSKESKRQ